MKNRLIAIILFAATILTVLPGMALFADTVDESRIVSFTGIRDVDVMVGTSFADAAGMLPDNVTLQMALDGVGAGALLHEANMEESDWVLYNADAITVGDGKIAIDKSVANVKAVTGDEYDNFVLEATLRGTANAPTNNFGIMLRANDITDATADSYNGYYVGIGKNDGKYCLVIGYADGKWHLIDEAVFDYKPNTDYDLKIMMNGATLAVWLDGELLYKDDSFSMFTKGSVGLRTYHQLFECSAFKVRTISDADLADAGIVLTEDLTVPVNAWTSENYDPDTAGSYTFKTTVKGTNYEVTCKVNVMTALEINEEMQNLSYLNVDITDGFFRDYIKQMVCKVVPTAIKNVEQGGGGMPNIINAAKMHRGESYGKFVGMFYVDSDVHKVLESMCYAIAIDPMGDADIIATQAQIKAKLEEWIPYFVDAQEESGYFDTYYTLQPGHPKFTAVDMHELYCMGHFMEAAIAHYECTGKTDTRLLDVAVKCADYLDTMFGPEEGKRKQIAGHQEIEIALLRLAKIMLERGDDYGVRAHKYADLAVYFLEVRGDYADRDADGPLSKPYWQDHAKVEDQMEAVGHAVRAQYMYTAMTELASIDEEYREKYDKALTSLWRDVTYTKQYITGGVGQTAANEGFDESYYLPNASAYCETCAGIANMMWNRSMSKLYAGSAFADQIETDIYNAVLGCVNLDGDKFYYHNALAGEELRNAWYGTACCPPNLTRTVLSFGGYIYNYNKDSLYINQYISNSATVPFGNTIVTVNMTSNMPWQGDGSVELKMTKDTEFALYLRMPYWSDKAEIKLNGKAVSASADKDGYIVIKQTFRNGDKIEFNFSMPVLFEETDEKVEANIGYVAVRRGPLVYCAEAADNNFRISLSYLDINSEATLEWTDSIDGKADPYGVRDLYKIKLNGYVKSMQNDKAVTFTLIPFYARLNREKGQMNVFLAKERVVKSLADFAIPSASYTYGGDSVNNLNNGTDDANARWTSWKSGDFLKNPWVQYDFAEEVVLSGCRILWYDDNGGVRLPDGLKIYYKNSETGEFTEVEHDDEYLCNTNKEYITYRFEAVEVTSLRIVIENSKAAAGIVEWGLIGSASQQDPVTPDTDPDTPDDPGNTEDPDTDKEPDTSDKPADTDKKEKEGTPIALIAGIVAAVLALAGVLVAVIFRKKKKA